MFIIQSNQPNYCTNTFASSSCHTEYDGKVESALQAKTSLGGLSRGLRRSGSNVSELSLPERCDYDVTQVEFDFSLKSQQSIHIRVETPCGEIGTLEFNEFITEHVFRPMQHGCGNGVWKIDVLQIVDGSETVRSSVSMPINGVGTLFFVIGDDLRPFLADKEFLNIPGACRKHSV
ncbi:hypothetical protein RB195_013493 [Necator americanus]|uniref:CUB domain-containing protein n=1 Tax=Necator americanus TaxID=51031 RepID=A0ABR1DYH9_NECAM